MRRILIIGGIVVAAIALGVLIFFLFFANPSGTLTTGTGTSSGNPFPAGAGDTGSGTGGTGSGTVTEGGTPAPVTAVTSRLIEITHGPVALGTVTHDITSTSTGTTTTDIETDYVDRASGNLFSYLTHANVLTRITARTIPGVQEAAWLPDGSMAYVRFLTGSDAGIQTYALPSNGSDGFFLADSLAEVASLPAKNVFTLASSGNGSIGSVMKPDGTNSTTVFSAPLTNLVAKPAGKNFIAYTPASAELDGYLFLVDSAGSFTRLIGPLNGLTALPSPSGASVLYSYVDSTGMHLAVMTVATRSTTPLPIATLTEKCVWAADSSGIYCAVPTNATDGTLPDDWYQGALSFTDRIWHVDLTSRVATLTVDLSTESKQAIDAVGLSIDSNSEVLDFMNKRDGSLWSYDL